MSVQDTNVEKLDVQEAKKASFGVNAEVPDPDSVKQAAVPGGSQQKGEVDGPMLQGSSVKPYTKVGMINSILDSLSGMKKADVSAFYDAAFKGDKTNPMQGSSVNPKNRSIGEEKIARLTAEDIDVSEDIKAIFAGTEVSEEFISKATEVYTAAILSKVNEQLEVVESKFTDSLTEETATISEELVERVDSYLDYVVEQWMEANSVAIERGLKAEIVESFMAGLKGLFEEHYIDIPDEAVEVAEELASKVEALESAINEEIEKNVELTAQLKEFERGMAFAEVSEGLTDTQVAKLQSLSEAVEFEDVATYKNKIATLRESYFPTTGKASQLSESVVFDEEPVGDLEESAEKQVPVEMAAYMNAIARGIKK
jgi:hypothetical protein